MVTVIYHAHCMDGFGAAWVAHRKHPDATFIAANYGEPPPDARGLVYVLDFSYNLRTLVAIANRADKVVVIDHHKTGWASLREFVASTPKAEMLFDLDHSGAVLAWMHFNPDEPVPEVLSYIEDRDLWRLQLPESKEVSAALRALPYEWETLDHADVATLKADGKPILRSVRREIDTIADGAWWGEVGGWVVPTVNSAIHHSDICDELLRRHSKAKFAAVYFDRADAKRQWSLRSRTDFDVSQVAQKYGGGGHSQAAGFETDRPSWSPL